MEVLVQVVHSIIPAGHFACGVLIVEQSAWRGDIHLLQYILRGYVKAKSLYVRLFVCVFVAPRKTTMPSCAACVTPGDSSIGDIAEPSSTVSV